MTQTEVLRDELGRYLPGTPSPNPQGWKRNKHIKARFNGLDIDINIKPVKEGKADGN